MLTGLEIGNFKAFGTTQKIPLKRITLIFGPNSSGKSSILHALSMLKQSRDTNDSTAVLQATNSKGFVDLCNFRNMMYAHDISDHMTFRFHFNPPQRVIDETAQVGVVKGGLEAFWEFDALPYFGYEILVEQADTTSAVKLKTVRLYIDESDKPILQLRDAGYYYEPFAIRYRWDLFRALELRGKMEQIRAEEILNLPPSIQWSFNLRKYKKFVAQEKKELSKLQYFFSGFLPARCYPESTRNTCMYGKYVLATGYLLDQFLLKLLPIKPIRNIPERWRMYSGTTAKSSTFTPEMVLDVLYRNKNLLKSVNDWLKKLGIRYTVRIEELTDALYEVCLYCSDTSTSIRLNLPDVGFGISQILPIVIQSIIADHQIITIEQPEVHLHPALQSEMGDLFIDTAIRRWNSYIIETHSEHLILRIMRRIRECKRDQEKYAKTGLPLITNKDVAVLYVDRKGDESVVKEMELDETGHFIGGWPKGFFADRLAELA